MDVYRILALPIYEKSQNTPTPIYTITRHKTSKMPHNPKHNRAQGVHNTAFKLPFNLRAVLLDIQVGWL